MEVGRSSRSSHRLTLLLGALLTLILLGPLLQEVRGGRLIGPLAGVAIPIAGIYAVSDRRSHLWTAVSFALPGVGANIWWLFFGDAAPTLVATVFPLLFFGYAAFVIGSHVFRSDRVTTDTLAGAACVYLLLGFAWWFAYLAIDLLEPGSFSGAAGLEAGGRLDLLYLSFVTLTTLGYGDVTPATPAARSFASVEAIVGVLFLAILIARLVGLYREANPGTPR